MTENWQDNIKNAPRAPGAYIMKDADGKVIYVGKAKDLESRTSEDWHHRLQRTGNKSIVR